MSKFTCNDNFAEEGRASRLVVVRQMKASDIGQVVHVHTSGFPYSRSTRLGRPFLRKMYEWYVRYQPQLSFVAVLDEHVVGFVTGTYGWGGARRRFRYAFWHILLGFLSRPSLLFSAAMFENGANFLKGLFSRRHERAVAPGDQQGVKVTLDSIAIHPAARGRDAGAVLIEAFEQAARRLGGGYLSLGVEADNRAARRLYEKCGWNVAHENMENNSVGYRKMLFRS